MITLKNPNHWSCLPTAFAMALNKPVEWFVEQIGHPGAEEPYGIEGLKAGFHEQECIEVVQREGYACTPIILVPTISPYLDKREARPIFFGLGESDNWERFLRHMTGASGVITGLYKNLKNPAKIIGHAVTWDHVEKKIRDPRGGVEYPFADAYHHGFIARCFWKIQQVSNVETHSKAVSEPTEG